MVVEIGGGLCEPAGVAGDAVQEDEDRPGWRRPGGPVEIVEPDAVVDREEAALGTPPANTPGGSAGATVSSSAARPSVGREARPRLEGEGTESVLDTGGWVSHGRQCRPATSHGQRHNQQRRRPPRPPKRRLAPDDGGCCTRIVLGACLQVRPVAEVGRLLARTAIGRARGGSTPDAGARRAGSPAAALARPTQQRESPHTHQRTTRLHRLHRLTPLNAALASPKSLRHWAAAGWQALPLDSATAETAQERQA
jgi:hypothetical protein